MNYGHSLSKELKPGVEFVIAYQTSLLRPEAGIITGPQGSDSPRGQAATAARPQGSDSPTAQAGTARQGDRMPNTIVSGGGSPRGRQARGAPASGQPNFPSEATPTGERRPKQTSGSSSRVRQRCGFLPCVRQTPTKN
jgi:hypothetical protein